MAEAPPPRRLRRSLRVREAEKLSRDMYEEIILRLPRDEPKLLFRFAMVSRTWRDILRDPGFFTRYRATHGVPPPILGYLYQDGWESKAWFVKTVSIAPLNPRLPCEGCGLRVLECRHGRVLFNKLGIRRGHESLVVWDPLSNHNQEVRLPEECRAFRDNWSAAILCDANPCNHIAASCHGGPFRVVLVGINRKGVASSCVYAPQRTRGPPPPRRRIEKPGAAAAQKIEKCATALVGDNIFFRTAGKTIVVRYHGGEVDRLSFIQAPP